MADYEAPEAPPRHQLQAADHFSKGYEFSEGVQAASRDLGRALQVLRSENVSLMVTATSLRTDDAPAWSVVHPEWASPSAPGLQSSSQDAK
jgi:hypothetical protein